MCGICGYVSGFKYDETVLNEMNNTMRHRGPDDAGVYQRSLSGERQLGIAQRRLSILDLSSAGHQPMLAEDESIAIVYNGEIYNFLELRERLLEKGYHFRSNCDTEVILYLYQEYGTECLSMLNGMFAFAIVDFRDESLFLARDRMGKKPLYYYYPENGNAFVFGSELKPLMKFPGFRKEIRTELVSAYLVNKCFDSPDTVFRDTYKVEPGQYIIWKNGILERETYWNLTEQYRKLSSDMIDDYAEARKGLKDLLLDAVSRRLIADVPVGTFLSGGIDSTLITALAKEVTDGPVSTFTIGFHDKKENEAEYAKAVAKYLGTSHTELYISPSELLQQVQDLATYYDEPFADSSQIPTMLVSKLAKKKVSVILSGDGGDELFCGYELYDWLKAAQYLDRMGGIGYTVCELPVIKKLNLINKLPDKAYAFLNNRDQETKVQLFHDVRERYTADMVIGTSLSSKREYEKKIKEIDWLKNNWQMQRMLLDMRYYMADEVLVKTDRASMKYSLEVRCPILDYRVAEYSFRLPHKFKYQGKTKKRILKDLVYEMVPGELLDRPKKGFGVPLAKWLREDLNGQLLRYADETILRRQGIFRPERIREFIRKLMVSDVSVYNSILWGFFTFQMWYQEYVEDLWGKA